MTDNELIKSLNDGTFTAEMIKDLTAEQIAGHRNSISEVIESRSPEAMKKKREEICSIKDPIKRQRMIAENLYLFR